MLCWVAKRLGIETSSDSISFMSSLCFHVLLILILAILTNAVPKENGSLLLSFSDPNMDFGFDDQSLHLISSSSSSHDQEMIEAETNDPLHLESNVTVKSLLEMETQRTQSPSATSLHSMIESTAASMGASTASTASDSAKRHSAGVSSLFAGSSLDGRNEANRNRLALQNGGNTQSEQAVEAALAWMAAHQAYDGSWSTEMSERPCAGRCSHGTEEIGSPKRIAATGLALLCFLGAGHTHKQGKYELTVDRGIQFLLKSMRRNSGALRAGKDSGGFNPEGSRYEMYEHGIAMLALCEACEMTTDTTLLDPCGLGIRYLIRCQHADGSWGYTPNVSGDLSIVGWQMMALKSANGIGIKIPPEVISKVERFMQSQSQENSYGSFYGYRSTQRDPCATAIGLLIRLYRGLSKTDASLIKGMDYIADLGPSTDGIYYNYYATQLLFHTQHPSWPVWNQMSRDYLVREQSQEGHEKGSWYVGRTHFNKVGGRLYFTAMATLSLEVYYRFMPIYAEIKQDDFQL
jgi:hypothetical protein